MASVIGGPPRLADPAQTSLGAPDRALLDSTAQGLVRFDAAGQIEPGLAERWIVIDGGMSYIFRLRDAEWADGKPVTAGEVVSILKQQLRASSKNPLFPFMSAIEEVVEMTPQVIEVRLGRPRPDLLKLFAQPEMAMVRLRQPSGSGPFRVVGSDEAPLLRPALDPNRADPDDPQKIQPEQEVRLIGERAGRAVARFANGDSDLVSGGTFVDWPLLATVDIRPAAVRLDPAAGLFGLAIVNRDGFLGDTLNRTALSQAIDRGMVTAMVARGWEPADRILPEALDSSGPPAVPAWTLLSLQERQAGARRRVAQWDGPVRLRIALPAGPGGTLLFAALASSLDAIGVEAARVAADAPADLRLIDSVAPYDSARWYLATACAPCGATAQAALEAARLAPTLATRGERIAEADAAMNEDVSFIPLARPLRWSLVSTRLKQWQANSRAWHPLNHVRADPN